MSNKKHKKNKKPQQEPVKTNPTPTRRILLPTFVLVAAIAAILILGPKDSDNGTYAEWFDKDRNGVVGMEIQPISSGDTVKFTAENKTYEIPNTDIVFWNNNGKRINPKKYDTVYKTNIAITGSITDFELIIYEYENDPACTDSPGYLLYTTDRYCYHAAQSQVTFTEISAEELQAEIDAMESTEYDFSATMAH